LHYRFPDLKIFSLALLTFFSATVLIGQQLRSDDAELQKIDVEEHLGSTIPLDLTFTNSKGEPVQLNQYFNHEKPILLNLAYYECPMLCTLILNGVQEGVQKLAWKPGNEFQMVTVSIDPGETWEMAAKKKQNYLSGFKTPVDESGWAFLTGKQTNITSLADALGFRYFYDPERDQYAHPAVTFILSEDGTISRYLYGLEYPENTLRLALLEASDGKIGNTLEKFILTCFHYDPEQKRYVLFAANLMRAGGVVTIGILAIFLGVYWIRERRKNKSE